VLKIRLQKMLSNSRESSSEGRKAYKSSTATLNQSAVSIIKKAQFDFLWSITVSTRRNFCIQITTKEALKQVKPCTSGSVLRVIVIRGRYEPELVMA
jgi:hypothetical protein